MDFFNKFSQKLSNYFKDEEILSKKIVTIDDTLIYLNSQVILWKYDSSIDDEAYNQVLNHRHINQYMIYNLLNRKIKFKKNLDTIIDFKTPDLPAYTLEFLLSFSVSARNWLSLDQYNVLIIHDDISNPKILVILSCLLSYLTKHPMPPMNAYSEILSVHNCFNEMNLDLYKNITRYINYFGNILVNPIIDYKNIHLKTIIVNAAPAIDNESDEPDKKYIIINEKSYYKPVLRIISNGKVVYCSYVKNKPIERVFFSPENCVKFDINNLVKYVLIEIFGDTMIELLHQQGNKFKQLFLIQFHTFFINSNILRFTKDQIDGICKDIRYPNEFFLDLIFDEDQSSNISAYEEDISKWKNVLSDFLMKSFKSKPIDNTPSTNKEGENINEDGKKILEKMYKESDHTNKDLSSSSSEKSSEKDDDMHLLKSTTMDKAKDILEKFSKKDNTKDEDEEDDDEDLENYLKNLENKKK